MEITHLQLYFTYLFLYYRLFLFVVIRKSVAVSYLWGNGHVLIDKVFKKMVEKSETNIGAISGFKINNVRYFLSLKCQDI